MTRRDPAVLAAVRELLPREMAAPRTGHQLAAAVSLRIPGSSIHIRRIGEAVRALREEGWLIDSGPRGYVVVTDAARIAKWEARETRRAKAILYVIGRRKSFNDAEIDGIIRQIPLFQENCQ